jgi:dTDP-L-rhamnose 4-epimerase
MTSILITGGAGFIGSRLVRALVQRLPDCRIWVLDNLHPQVHGAHAAVPAFPANVTFLRGDVADADAVQAAVQAAMPQIVYHLAAETGTGQSYDMPSHYTRVNVLGTTYLAEALRACPATRTVVLAGSRAVYGEGAYRDAAGREFIGQPREEAPMRVGDFAVRLPESAQLPAHPAPSHGGLPVAPASIYASTKLMQEYVLTQLGEGTPWRANLLRFQNVYGPGQSLRNPYTGVLSIFARQLLNGESLAIYEDGNIARDFVFVDDVVEALVLTGIKDVPHGWVMDIGTGRAETILDVARILMRNLGRADDAYRITGAFRIGDIRHACADIRKAGQILGWKPRVSVESGLAQLAKWAQEEFANGNL